jgi:hypothetical protein
VDQEAGPLKILKQESDFVVAKNALAAACTMELRV